VTSGFAQQTPAGRRDIVRPMALRVRSRSGRAEFGRVYLRSLIAATEERIELHRTRGDRLRLALATRRLRKLLAYENTRDLPVGTAEAPPKAALMAVSAVWLALMAVLGIVGLDHASSLWLTLLEVPALALAVLWFFLAIACVPADRPG
jgi:hypothetical protein